MKLFSNQYVVIAPRPTWWAVVKFAGLCLALTMLSTLLHPDLRVIVQVGASIMYVVAVWLAWEVARNDRRERAARAEAAMAEARAAIEEHPAVPDEGPPGELPDEAEMARRKREDKRWVMIANALPLALLAIAAILPDGEFVAFLAVGMIPLGLMSISDYKTLWGEGPFRET